MKYTIDKEEKYSLVRLDEEKLDSVLAPELKSEFVKLNTGGVRNLILDLSPVKYVDSSGLSAILVANRLCENSRGMLVVAAPSEHVTKLLKISRLDAVLNILPSVEEAIDAVAMNEIESDLRGE